MSVCIFPTCDLKAEPTGYCFRHTMYANSVSVKVPKDIPKKSNKQKEIDKELKKMYLIFLSKPENKYCKVKMPGCTKIANVIHHVRGRIGDQVFEVKDWLPCCPNCNSAVESQDATARENGLKKSKFHE